MTNMFEKHINYLSTLWTISLVLGYISAVIDWFHAIFTTAQDGNVFGFILMIILNGVWMAVVGFIGAVVVFVVLFFISVLPYLVIRGLSK